MDEQRLRELERKRFEGGLTDEEANELGRLYARAEGKPHSNARRRPHAEESSEAWKAEGKGERAKVEEESGRPADVDVTRGPDGEHQPEEHRAVGTERQPVGPAGSGYVPPKGSDESSG